MAPENVLLKPFAGFREINPSSSGSMDMQGSASYLVYPVKSICEEKLPEAALMYAFTHGGDFRGRINKLREAGVRLHKLNAAVKPKVQDRLKSVNTENSNQLAKWLKRYKIPKTRNLRSEFRDFSPTRS
ncbi:hypothetical protein ES703_99019 [subsurface metagenome]